MAVKIRLSQTGSKNKRKFRIVVVEESKKRDGAVIETVGYVNPTVRPKEVVIKTDRIEYWKSKGAQVTEGAQKIISSS